MPDNISDDINDLFTRHDINLMRMQASMRRKVVKLLNGMNKEIIDMLRRIDPSEPVSLVYRNRRLKQLVDVTRDTLDRYFTTLQRQMEGDLRRVASLESVNAIQTINSVLQFELVSKSVNEEVLKSLARNTLIEGSPAREWLQSNRRRYLSRFKRTLSESVLIGDPIQTMTRRVRDFFPATQREAEALVRSSVQAVAQEARYETYKANDDVVKGQQWLATLDNRTTDICKSLDGQAWTLDGNPLPGSTASWRGPPPAHWNCRSTLVPVMKSWEELSSDPKAKKKLKKLDRKDVQRLKATAQGKPGGRINYERWLRNQSTERQKEILGPGRYRLWKRRRITTRDLIDQTHRPLTLEQLEEKVRRRHKFKSGADWYSRFTPSSLSSESILDDFGPEVRRKIKEVQEQLEKVTTTDKIYFKNGKWAPERQKLHSQIMLKFLSPERVVAAKPLPGKKPRYVMFGGRGGSGKGSFTKTKSKGGLEVIKEDEFIILDADEIKKMLPEYKGWNAWEVHEESSYIFDMITERAKRKGLNIVHDMTLKTGKTAINRARDFVDAGYELEGYYMFLPPQMAAKRAVGRFMGPTNRYVPLDVILGNTRNEANFDDLMRFFKRWEFYDNQGSGPELIAHG